MNKKLGKKFLNYLKYNNHIVYYHIFSYSADESFLDWMIDDVKERINSNNDYWFEGFHKQIRQTDFFEKGDEGCGHLDMILWNYINESNPSLDKILNDFLKDAMFY